MTPVLYLIDGHALAYRTYFALSAAGGDRFRTKSGEPTAGTYGFASVLLRILEQDKPEYLAVTFDTGKTFRDKIYPQYKATREKMPDDLRPQIERIREMIDTFGIPRLEMEGYEADDVLGSVAQKAVEQGFGVKIITGDRDLLQLVNDRIIVNLAGSKLSEAKDYTKPDVIDSLGVEPDQVVDYKALVGDNSDNIPGVPGVGVKTATALLSEYKTLDAVYEHLDDLQTRVRNKLEAGRDSAYMSYDLARIRCDLDVVLEVEDARTNDLDLKAAEELFRTLEFRTLLNRLRNLGREGGVVEKEQLSLFGEPLTVIGSAPAYDLKGRIIDTPDKLQDLQRMLDKYPSIAFDTETTSTDPMLAELVGISLSVQEGEGFYIPVGHKSSEPQLEKEQVLEALRPALTDANKEKVGHNLKYDGLVLTQQGLSPQPYTFDTMIAEWLLHPESRRLGLKDMADEYLHIQMTHIEDLIGKGKGQISMAEVPISRAADYAAADAEICVHLRPLLQEKLDQQNVSKLFYELEMPLVPVLAEMERAGIGLDALFLDDMSVEISERLENINNDVYKAVGYPFNLNSTQQLSKALFETLKLEPPDRRKKTSSGHYSTSASVLESIRSQHEAVEWLLEYRELSKLKSTYLEALPKQINPSTGRVHTSFNQTGSVTGRMASSNPNLQNIPTRSEIGRKVRKAFIADEGMQLLSVDYSQIELRVVAHMSGDEAMLETFRKGQDIHAATAAAIYGVGLDEVSGGQRRHAKAINFGLIYGMSSFGLSRTTDLTLAEAEDFVKAYFDQYPKVKEYLDGLRKSAASQGYVETLLGRRRYFPNLSMQMNNNLRQREEREAINAPVQGTAADIIKLAMIRMPSELEKQGLSARMLLQVHDELVLECPQDELDATVQVVRSTMENAFPLSIPLSTDVHWGSNWGELK